MANQTPTNQSPVGKAKSELKAVFEMSQGGQTQTYLIHKDRVVFGSVESADIKIIGSQIAPIHAVMELNWGANESQCTARILDLASPSGVFVNGNKIINQVVKSGDQIQLGDAKFAFAFKKPEFQASLPDQALILIAANEVKQIFDYRPPVKEALEVVYSWNDTILDVKHFVDQSQKTGEVTLGGTTGEDFLVPPVFTNGSVHTLASKSGSHWVVFIDPKMKGVLYLNGELHSIETYRREKLGNDARGAVTLGDQDFAKIEAGTVSFYLSQTVAPPVLRKQTTIIADPFLAKSLFTSLILTAILFFAVSKIDNTQTEVVQVPEVIATILYHPEKYSIKKIPIEKKEEEKKAPEPEKPKKAEADFTKPKPKEQKVAQTKSAQPGKKQAAQSQSKEGAGAKAAGEEGKRGAKNATSTAKPTTAAKRPSPEAGVGRGGTVSQVPDNGNVQMMKGATNKILDLLGGSGEKLGKSGSKLSGFGGFSTQGNGGAGLSGGGKGGGGTADTLLGGLGDHGRGGGKVGTGLGAEGTGAGIVGGKTRVELNAGGGDETVVIGSIDRDAIEAAIRAHKDEFNYCYERELNAGQPNLSGKIVTAFVIGGSGRASQLAIASSSMGSPNVERCVLGVLSRIQFPQPAGGVPVTIKYPFAYSNSNSGK
jgi:outer membrane biosynthesis protein TonB